MSNEDRQIQIGDLARRSGLSVRTLRFYADTGVLAEDGRTEAGYRLFGPEAPAQARLIRTLRELGLDLETIRRVLAGELTVPEVAARHAAALDAQIRHLRLQRGVLRAIANKPDDPEVLEQMHDLATLTAAERQRLIDDFISEVFADLPEHEVRNQMEAAHPDLPEDPTPEQVDAWVELANLVADPEFRARVREMAVRGSSESDGPGIDDPAAAETIGRVAAEAVAQDTDPASAAGGEILERLLTEIGEPEDRVELADSLATFTDRRVGRYWALVGKINGWPPRPDAIPAWEWFATALRSHPRPAASGAA